MIKATLMSSNNTSTELIKEKGTDFIKSENYNETNTTQK